MSIDELVESVRLYQRRPLWAHFYAAPFAVLYAVWVAIWLKYVRGVERHAVLLV
jgi:hypothetical protein